MMTSDDGRLSVMPSHSTEAEQSVLGALLLDNSAWDNVADIVDATDFYLLDNREIFSTIQTLVLASKLADPVTVFERGGHELSYLQTLSNSVPSARHARHYAEIVRERSIERELQRLGMDVTVEACKADKTVHQKIDEAMARLTQLGGAGQAERESVPIDAAVVQYLDQLSEEAQGNTKIISTGLRALDRMLSGGLRAGELMLIGARPKMGKTALVLTLGRNISRAHGVLLLSQEMPVSELVARNIAAVGTVNLSDLRRGREIPDEVWGSVSEAAEKLRQLNLVLDEQRGLTLADVRRKVMAAKRRQPIDVVIVDFLQLMDGAGEGDNRNQQLDVIANGLKKMAGEFGVAVVVLSQMNREADKRKGPPVMTDLRDSGAIEAAADIIALLYREFAHPLGSKEEQWRHHAQVEIVQRNGAPGHISLWFSGEHQQFADWEGQTPRRSGGSRGGDVGEGLS